MALRDPASGTPAVPLGCCSSIIGLDSGTVHKTLADPKTAHFGGVPYTANSTPRSGNPLNTSVTLTRIGGATANVEDTQNVAGKALAFQAAAGAVAIGGVVANLYVNKTGKALVAGDVVLASAP